MPTFGFAPCATTGCSGSYRIVSRTNWQNFQHGAPLIGGGFCPDCRKAQRERQLVERREFAAEYAARRARDALRDRLVEAMMARLGLTEHDVNEIHEYTLRKIDRERDAEDNREMGGER